MPQYVIAFYSENIVSYSQSFSLSAAFFSASCVLQAMRKFSSEHAALSFLPVCSWGVYRFQGKVTLYRHLSGLGW